MFTELWNKLFGEEVKTKKAGLSPCDQRVLNNLTTNGETSIYDYGRGFRLSARILTLRQSGYIILTVPYDPIDKDNRLARHILVAK